MFKCGIGIDLGTQITSAARKVDSTLVFVKDAGSHHIPSLVAYDDDEIFVGDTANTHKNVIFASKRLLGKKFGETCSRYLESDADGYGVFRINHDTIRPERVSKDILQYVRGLHVIKSMTL